MLGEAQTLPEETSRGPLRVDSLHLALPGKRWPCFKPPFGVPSQHWTNRHSEGGSGQRIHRSVLPCVLPSSVCFFSASSEDTGHWVQDQSLHLQERTEDVKYSERDGQSAAAVGCSRRASRSRAPVHTGLAGGAHTSHTALWAERSRQRCGPGPGRLGRSRQQGGCGRAEEIGLLGQEKRLALVPEDALSPKRHACPMLTADERWRRSGWGGSTCGDSRGEALKSLQRASAEWPEHVRKAECRGLQVPSSGAAPPEVGGSG